ncbi:hypothetical protein BLSTO_05850 [Blastocystis sp. subtype 1]
MEDTSSGYSWSSVFSSIKGDLSDLRSSVSKGASDLYTYVKDSVPEELKTAKEGEPKDSSSFTSRLSGFITSTVTKAKEALDEVLEETEEPEVAYGLAGGMTRRDVDDNERFRVMNTDARTYSVLEEDEKADYEQWLQQRDLVSLHSLKMSLIKEHPVIQVMYHRLVPSAVSDSQFWNFYFFHMEKAGYDFYKGQEHVEEKSEPTVGSPVKELLQSKELEEWSDVDLSDKENPKDLEEAVADVNGAIDVDVTVSVGLKRRSMVMIGESGNGSVCIKHPYNSFQKN